MKKKHILIGALIPLAIILASCGGIQQTSSTTPPTSESTTSVAEDAIKDLEITSMPSKTEYKEGEEFKTAGLKFNIIYESGEVETGLTGADLDSYSPRGPLTTDVTHITITIDGFSKDIPITVTPKTLQGVEITREPDVKTYELGDSFDLTGLTVQATYEEGVEPNETKYVVTDKDGNVYEQGKVLDVTGEIELTVSVTSNGVTKTDTFTITVYSGITVQVENVYDPESGDPAPTDQSYTVISGNSMDLEFNDDNSKTHLKQDSTFTGEGYLGDINVGLKIEFYIYSSADMENADIVLIASSTKTLDSEQKMDDMNVNKIFKMYFGEDNEEIWLSDDLIIQGKEYPPTGSATTKWTNWVEVPLGQMDIKQGYNKITLETIGAQAGSDNYPRTPNIDKLEIRSSSKAEESGDFVTGVNVTSHPSKLTYNPGDVFDPTGLKFDVTYRNGYDEDKGLGPDAEYLSWTPDGPLGSNDTEITFTYKNYSWKETIEMVLPDIQSVELTSLPSITNYTKGTALNLGGLVVKATYENGYVDENAKNYSIKDEFGNVYEDGDLLDKDYSKSSVTFYVEIVTGDVAKQASFVLNISTGIEVEAEHVYEEGVTGPTESYTKITTDGDGARIKTNANKQTAVENIKKGNIIDFFVYSDSEVTDATLVLVASSINRVQGSTETKDTKFNDIFSLKVDDQAVSVGDDVMVKGRTGQDGESIWFLWTESVITSVNLKKGYNKISLECTGYITDFDGSQRAANVDKIKIQF